MKKMRFHHLFFLFFISPFLLTAQSITWEKLNGPSGGTGQVFQGKDGYLILKTDFSRLYRSNNGGQFWEPLPPPPPSFSIVVGADRNLYAGATNKLYQSVDNGLSWDLISDNISVYSIFALPGGQLLIGTFNRQIRRSLDNGLNWEVVANNLELGREFAYNPYTGDVFTWDDAVYPGETAKLWRSSDQGQTWNSILEGFERRVFQMAFSPDGAIFASTLEYIMRSLDGGATWTQLDGPVQNSSWEYIYLNVTSTGRLFASESFISAYSDDNGTSWQPLTDETGNFLTRFSSDIEGQVFATRVSGSVYITEDNGVNWHFASNNVLDPISKQVLHLDAERILAFTRDGLFYTNDGGASWELIWDKVISENMYALEDDMLAASSNGNWYLWNGKEQIVRFKDEGQTHELFQVPGLAGLGTFNGLWYSSASQLVFCSTQSGFYSSADEGQTWTLQSADFIPKSVVPMPDGNLLEFDYNGIYRSTNNGQNWTLISDIGFWNARGYTGPNGMLYGIKSGPSLFISPDGGLTWDSIHIDSETPILDVAVNNAGHIFLYNFSENALLRSVDGGLTFNPLAGPNDRTFYYSGHAMSLGTSQYLYLIQESDGIYRSTTPTTDVKMLTGSVWHDLDIDCIYGQPDSLIQRQLVKLSGNNETSYGYSNSLGRYFAPVASGDYQVSVALPNDYWSSCNTAIIVPNNQQTGVVDSVDIGIQALIQCAQPTVSVSMPFLRRCFESAIYVQYANTGTLPAPDTYLTIILDDFLEFNWASLPVAAQNGNTYTFVLGDLGVSAFGGLTINVTPSCDAALGEVHCVEAHIYPNAFCPELNTPHIVTSAVCLGDTVQLRIDNVGSADMTEPLSWFVPDVTSVDLNATLASGTFLLEAGEAFTTTIASGYHQIEFIAQQAPQYPFNVISKTTIQGCGVASGSIPLRIFNEDDAGPFTDVLCRNNIGAFDPNDKQGMPAGLTENGYIEHRQTLRYLIRFQNTGTDTAMNVSVRDTLPGALDPATVKLLNSSHPSDLRIMPNGSLLFVFDHIMLPDSNINESASHGFVEFSVEQQPGIPTGTIIQNKASIYFDFNEPVITNKTLHTVGIPDVVITDTEEPLTSGDGALQIMPNPFKGSFDLRMSSGIPAQFLRVQLYDNYGRLVAEKAFYSNKATILRDNLPVGVYHILVLDAAGKRLGSGTAVAD